MDSFRGMEPKKPTTSLVVLSIARTKSSLLAEGAPNIILKVSSVKMSTAPSLAASSSARKAVVINSESAL